MYDETFVECMVSRKPSVLMRFLYFLFLLMTIFFCMIGIVPNLMYFLLLALGTGFLCRFIHRRINIEYEYSYCSKELSIDKIFDKSSRKSVCTFDIDKMEIFAPVNSYHLDDYRKRSVKESDYSSSISSQPEKRYAMYYNGDSKIILEPNEELVKALKNAAPRKVFTD